MHLIMFFPSFSIQNKKWWALITLPAQFKTVLIRGGRNQPDQRTESDRGFRFGSHFNPTNRGFCFERSFSLVVAVSTGRTQHTATSLPLARFLQAPATCDKLCNQQACFSVQSQVPFQFLKN